MKMGMVINTNNAASNAILNLTRVNQSMQTSMERLTSGIRINHASDDAAGLAVVTGMTSQINGIAKATQNANDGTSLIQTMDSATDDVVNMLQRMRDLSAQSLNGTYTATNRADMDAEFQQLKTEIDRVGKTTNFNGINLLDGTTTNADFQVGPDGGANNKISVTLMNVQTAGLPITADTVLTQAAASTALTNISTTLGTLQTNKAKWGAVINRLNYTTDNLMSMSSNLSASRSRIQDADYSKESANMARTQVLQQAGMAMLSQANQQSQNILALLK
jgi:flagellin